MLRFFNSLGKKIAPFHPLRKGIATIFTCGPSVYQRSHIGNFRTFLFEDVLVRYLEYSGYAVQRGMNFTDIEDKAIEEAMRMKIALSQLTGDNIRNFLLDSGLLRMKIPDYMPRSSEYVEEAVKIIEKLLPRGIAYRHSGNIYFAPLKVPGFGKLYGLDMSKWPVQSRRFHKDTYPGIQWNLGDFILWHGYREGDVCFWNTKIGRGRPSWNIQDPAMVIRHFNKTLDIYCGGIDNLYRHHDYSMAIVESVRPYHMSRFWLHCNHLYADGKKMSKSKGNIYYIETLIKQGFTVAEVRFFLIYNQYRKQVNFSRKSMQAAADKLAELRAAANRIKGIAAGPPSAVGKISEDILKGFKEKMDDDLDVKGAVDRVSEILSGVALDNISPEEAAGTLHSLAGIDEVLKVIFEQ